MSTQLQPRSALPSQEQMWMDDSPVGGGARSSSLPKSCFKVALPHPPPPAAAVLNVRRPSCAMIGTRRRNISRSAGNERASQRVTQLNKEKAQIHHLHIGSLTVLHVSPAANQAGAKKGERKNGRDRRRYNRKREGERGSNKE